MLLFALASLSCLEKKKKNTAVRASSDVSMSCEQAGVKRGDNSAGVCRPLGTEYLCKITKSYKDRPNRLPSSLSPLKLNVRLIYTGNQP